MTNKQSLPIKKAETQIKVAYIFAYISTFATLIFAITEDSLLVIDALITFILALILHIKKSRVALIIILILYLLPRMLDPSLINSTNLFVTILFIAVYVIGIIGSFSYHKLKKDDSLLSLNEKNES